MSGLPSRFAGMVGKRFDVRVSWIEAGTQKSVVHQGVLHTVASAGRSAFMVFDSGSLAIETSRIVEMVEVGE